jgi:hypothetical protein
MFAFASLHSGKKQDTNGISWLIKKAQVHTRVLQSSGTDVGIFKNICAKKWAFLTPNKAKYLKSLIITFVFFRRKWSKIADCDHNIDPRSQGDFRCIPNFQPSFFHGKSCA